MTDQIDFAALRASLAAQEAAAVAQADFPPVLDRLAQADKRLAALDVQKARVREERIAALQERDTRIRSLVHQGVSPELIAQGAGIVRQRVLQIAAAEGHASEE